MIKFRYSSSPPCISSYLHFFCFVTAVAPTFIIFPHTHARCSKQKSHKKENPFTTHPPQKSVCFEFKIKTLLCFLLLLLCRASGAGRQGPHNHNTYPGRGPHPSIDKMIISGPSSISLLCISFFYKILYL